LPVRWLGRKDPRSHQSKSRCAGYNLTDTPTVEFWIGSGKSKAFGDDDRGEIKEGSAAVTERSSGRDHGSWGKEKRSRHMGEEEKASSLTFNEGTKKFGPIYMKWLPRIEKAYGSGDLCLDIGDNLFQYLCR